MKNRNNLIAGALLVILVIVYFAFKTGPQDTKQVDGDRFQFDTEGVGTIVVLSEDDTLRFTRMDREWLLDGYPADTNRVNALLEEFSTLTADRIVSTKVENHTKYEVGPDGKRIRFVDAGDARIEELILGKSGSNYMETMVRREAEDAVYAVKASLGRYRNATKSGYWNRSITSFGLEEIVGVRFSGMYDYSLKLNEGVWDYNGVGVDPKKVEDLLRPLGNMRASNFRQEWVAAADPALTISIDLYSGQNLELKFHEEGEEGSVMITTLAGNPMVFEFSKSSLNRYEKTLEDLQVEDSAS